MLPRLKMNFIGRIGTENATAILDGKTVTITHKKKTEKKTLMFVACQRYNKKLKDFDVIWMCSDTYIIHTIPTVRLDDLQNTCRVPIFDIGLDPGPWKNWWTQSQKNSWKFQDWQFMLTPITSEEEDSDWEPGDDSHLAGDDSDEFTCDSE